MLPQEPFEDFPFDTEAFDDYDDIYECESEEERFWKSKKFRQLIIAS